MLSKRVWTLVLFSLFVASIASAGLFPFLKCSGGECQFCLASSAGGSNKVCSKSYRTNPGASDPTPGVGNISKELTDDLTNKLLKIKEFPEEGFDVKEFYEKYAEYSCERATQEIEFIEKQIKYLEWKLKKIQESKSKRKCDK